MKKNLINSTGAVLFILLIYFIASSGVISIDWKSLDTADFALLVFALFNTYLGTIKLISDSASWLEKARDLRDK